MNETDLFTPQEYANYRRCSLRTLDRERADGRGCPYVRLGARILYRRNDIDRYLEAHVRGGADWVGKEAGDPAGIVEDPYPDEGPVRSANTRGRLAGMPAQATSLGRPSRPRKNDGKAVVP